MNLSPNSLTALHKYRATNKRKVPVNHYTLLNLIEALQNGTYSMAELAEESGLHYHTVRNFCKLAHERKMIHIVMWEKDTRGRDMVRIYKWGKGIDAKRTKKSVADRARAYKAKLRMAKLSTSLVSPSL